MNDLSEKKDLIIANFIKLVQEYGINRVTLSDVAQRSGLTKSGLYYYFDSKEGLFLETLNTVYTKIREIVERDIEPIADPIAKIHRFITLQVEIFSDESLGLSFLSHCSLDMMEEIERFIFSSPALVARMSEIHRSEQRYLEQLLAAVLAPCGVSESEIRRRASLLFLLIEGFLYMSRKVASVAHTADDVREIVSDARIAAFLAETLSTGVVGEACRSENPRRNTP